MSDIPKKILIVDDDRSARLLIKNVLKGYDVDEAENGVEALKKISSFSPDLILLDNRMPHMDGLETLEAIMKKDSRNICLMLTGDENVQLAVQSLKKGAVDFIIKPFDSLLLKCSIDRILKNEDSKKKNELTLSQKTADLEKINCELDNFVHMVSHDLRAPLRGIAAFAGFLKEDNYAQLNKEGREYIDNIIQGTKHLDTLITDLLTLSQISRIKNPYETVVIRQLLMGIEERIAAYIKEHNVKFIISEDMPRIVCDRIKLGEVFLNLINNAVKFSLKNNKEQPRVEVGYQEIEGACEFFVRDNGIGIAPEYHEKIFEIFKQLHTDKEYEGTGAGLNIVQRVVEDHGGTLRVESELGQGACFYFTIPKDLRNEKYEETRDIPKAVDKDWWRVLVVDDDTDNRDLLVQILAEHAICDPASDGQAALKAYNTSIQSQRPYDLILLDIAMPYVTGLEVLDEIRDREAKKGISEDERIPIIVVSAFEENFLKIIKSGCTDYILKPVKKDILIEKIKQVLR